MNYLTIKDLKATFPRTLFLHGISIPTEQGLTPKSILNSSITLFDQFSYSICNSKTEYISLFSFNRDVHNRQNAFTPFGLTFADGVILMASIEDLGIIKYDIQNLKTDDFDLTEINKVINEPRQGHNEIIVTNATVEGVYYFKEYVSENILDQLNIITNKLELRIEAI